MKSNIVLLMFTVLLSIAIVAVQNRSLSKRSHKNHGDDQAINWCPISNDSGKKNLQNTPGKLSENMQRLKKAAKTGMMINKIRKLPAGTTKELIERDLYDSINIYLKKSDNVSEEFQKMLNNDESFPQSVDWVEKFPKCFGNISEQDGGNCFSNHIFATVNYFSILRCLNNEPKILTPLSTQDVVSCMKTDDGDDNCQGGSPKDVWYHLYTNGVVSHSCKCYKSHDYGKNPIEKCENKCNDSSIIPINFKTEVKEMILTKEKRIFSTLLHNYGILIGFIFYDGHYDLNNNDEELTKLNSGVKLSVVMEALYPKKNPDSYGLNVIVVGYKFKLDDECREILPSTWDYDHYNCVYFKILNSWGKTFGNNGYAYIPANFLKSVYLGFAYKEQVKRFTKENLLNKDIYTFVSRNKNVKLDELLKHHIS